LCLPFSGSNQSSIKESSRQSSKKDAPSPSATNQLDELMMSLANFGDDEQVRGIVIYDIYFVF